METRLFWIGVVMGLYAYASRIFKKKGLLKTRKRCAAWHAIFYGLSGFSITLIAILSIESRVSFISPGIGIFNPREIVPGIIGGLLLAAFGYWRAWTHGTKADKRRYYLGEDLEWSETVFSAIILAALLMYFVIQAFKIPSGSMKQTLLVGDHLFVNKFIYGLKVPLTDKRLLRFRDVQRGDIIVFRFPTEDYEEEHCGSIQYGKDFIKRVIGLPGEKVEIKKRGCLY